MSDSPASARAPAPGPGRAAPGWLPWLCFGLLALPFHPLWVDFEQVRRGLLLMLCGGLLLSSLHPSMRLVPARGERVGWLFVTMLAISLLVQAGLQSARHDDDTPWSLQFWLAGERLAHWVALLVLVRAGATTGPNRTAVPLATLLLLTSAFGLLQRLGLAEILGYGVEREPVTTLGNLNVASEWTAVAATGVAVLLPRMAGRLRVLGLAALAFAGAYLVVNHSRSGMVALPICLALLAVMRRRERGFVPLLPVLAGAAIGLAADLAVSRPAAADHRVESQELQRSTSTIAVRLQIANSAFELFSESPVFGRGPGQFQVHYPRVRSEAEIEASSFGRRFRTEVRTAHDDWLELLVDGGLPALVLFSAMLFALQRGQRDKVLLLPMLALLLLMLVRAPIGNAPAAAVAFWLIGAPVDRDEHGGERRDLLARLPCALTVAFTIVLGVLLLALGLLPVAGNTAFTGHVRALREGEAPSVAPARAASAWMPYEPRWLEAEARLEMSQDNLPRASHLAARAVALRPFSPPLLLLLAETLARRGAYGEAIQVADFALQFDANDPELHVLKSTALAELGDVERAIQAVVVDPHPKLRHKLENHFRDLANRAATRREPRQQLRYSIEQAFAGLCSRFGNDDLEVTTERNLMIRDLLATTREAGRLDVDIRPFVCAAIQALEVGDESLAAEIARSAATRQTRIERWQAELLGEHADRLREVPGWAPMLPSPPR